MGIGESMGGSHGQAWDPGRGKYSQYDQFDHKTSRWEGGRVEGLANCYCKAETSRFSISLLRGEELESWQVATVGVKSMSRCFASWHAFST